MEPTRGYAYSVHDPAGERGGSSTQFGSIRRAHRPPLDVQVISKSMQGVVDGKPRSRRLAPTWLISWDRSPPMPLARPLRGHPGTMVRPGAPP
jgi:hypothetical protein